MAKVTISEALKDEILMKFKEESKVIFRQIYSLEENPNKGKLLGNVGGIVIKEIKYKNFRFYFITDGYKLKVMDESALTDLLMRFVRMSDKLVVLDYKTRGYALKEDTAEHYRLQQNVYNFLLRKNGYQTEDFFFLLFYVPREVMETGEVIFDTELVKMKVDIKMAENAWKKALKLLSGDCPKKSCEWYKIIYKTLSLPSGERTIIPSFSSR